MGELDRIPSPLRVEEISSLSSQPSKFLLLNGLRGTACGTMSFSISTGIISHSYSEAGLTKSVSIGWQKSHAASGNLVGFSV